MPERPDLDYVVPILDRELRGARVAAVRVKKPVVLRVAVAGEFARLLEGREIRAVRRRAHFVRFDLAGGVPELELVVAPMLAGRFAIAPAGEKSPGDLAVAWLLEGGRESGGSAADAADPLAHLRELRYRDDVQMGKVYLIARGAWAEVPGLAAVGVDVLDRKAFTRARFRELARARRDQAKVFLMDKAALDALGSAYADEVLFEARIHPKTFVRALPDAELDRLHDAIVAVLSSARAEIARRKPALDEKLRDFLKVRNRHGAPCPRCGAKVRKAGVHGHDAFFCPECQPETRKTGIVDWRKLGGAGARGEAEP